jgi:O-antigen/teichoic acid export membrane protein
MSSHRIIVNTAATYIRSVITLGLGLFSARWVLGGLGTTDYGLFAVVGSIISFITFLNGVMAASASRHFAFALGRGDSDEVNLWFNTSLSIHVILPVVLIAIGWPIGEYCVRHVFIIPAARISASLWVFRLSLITAFVGMVSIPYLAMFTAQQHIAEMAVWGTLQSVLLFAFAYLLTRVSVDRLLFYTGYGVAISVVFQVIQILRARCIFRECRIHYRHWFDKCRFKEIFSFASWNLIGNAGAILRDQGSAILLNLHFGPKVNAAFGIANQVSVQTSQLGVAMVGAFAPEINASEGRGDRQSMLSLAQRASKFGTILILLFAIPLMVETDYILTLWLVDPPAYAALFCQLILAMFLLDRLSIGYMLAINAHGKVAGYQSTLGTCLILTLPLAWILLTLGLPPTSVGIAMVVTMAAVSTGRVFWARKLLGVPVKHWLRQVVLPTGTVTLAACLAVMLPRWLLLPSIARLMFVTAAGLLTTLTATWFLALDADDRTFVRQNTKRLWDSLDGESRGYRDITR